LKPDKKPSLQIEKKGGAFIPDKYIGTWVAIRKTSFQNFTVQIGEEFEVVAELDDREVIVRKEGVNSKTLIGIVQTVAEKK